VPKTKKRSKGKLETKTNQPKHLQIFLKKIQDEYRM
jgi:hypothetical protein